MLICIPLSVNIPFFYGEGYLFSCNINLPHTDEKGSGIGYQFENGQGETKVTVSWEREPSSSNTSNQSQSFLQYL